MLHDEPHPLAGKSVAITVGAYAGMTILIEDWCDRVAGKSWMDCDGNLACLEYAVRRVGTPIDDEVVYGKIGPFGKLIHISELGSPV